MPSLVSTHFRQGGLDFGDPVGAGTPWMVHTDALVEVPKHAPFTGFRNQHPRNDGPAQLLVERIGAQAVRATTLGMVMEKAAIRVLAERRIPSRAKD